MDIGFFFNYNNLVVQLPINPAKLDVTNESKQEESEIVALGDISILRGRKLSTIKFDSFLPYDTWFPGIRTTGEFRQPDFYKDFFNGIMEDAQPCRFIVTGLDINMLVSIDAFNFFHQAGDHEDAYYSIALKEYTPYTIYELDAPKETVTKPKKVVKPVTKDSSTSKAIIIGSNVILNGRVHMDSYGSKPGRTFSNYKGKVNFIKKGRSHPYHVTTPSGGWLGWVIPSAVKAV